MESALRQNEKMLVLFVDGFALEVYHEANKRKLIPNIASGELFVVFASNESVTNTGYATMITGVTPDIHGVHNRDYRSLNVPTIFQIALDLGIGTAFLEGNAQMLDTEISPILHINGDYEIIESTKKSIADGDGFIFTHLHELDELGHLYGVDHEKIYEYITQLDIQIGKLMEQFDGKILITTDHGMHNNGDAGDHGDVRYEDCIIPMIQLYER